MEFSFQVPHIAHFVVGVVGAAAVWILVTLL
jgi:hypothetical protein